MSNEIIISDDIKDVVKETQDLIIDFFEQTLVDQFDNEKRSKVQKVFDSYSVISEDEMTIHFYGGRCSIPDKKIELNRDSKVYAQEQKCGMDKRIKIIHELIHEYGHAFSNMDISQIDLSKINFIDAFNSRKFEEGMMTSFADLVINYYFKKNNISGRGCSIGYGKEENSLARTVLYGLSKCNLDNLAMAEYLLSDKRKFLSMFLIQSKVDEQVEDKGYFVFNFSLKDLFGGNVEFFKELDENSIYLDNNTYIYAMWLQNYVDNDVLSEEFLNCKSKDEILALFEEKNNNVFQVR